MDQPSTSSSFSKYESGVQLFSRVNSRSHMDKAPLDGINRKLFPTGPWPDQVVEVLLGKEIDSSDILIDFIVKSALPPEFGDDCKGVSVIIFNTEFHIKLLKVIKVIETKIQKNKSFKGRKKDIIESTLKNILFLNCYTTDDLEITFYNLERIVHNHNNVGLVVLDNVTSHFWSSKYDKPMLSYDEHINRVTDLLYKQTRDLNVVILYTNRIDERTQTLSQKKRNQIATTTIWIEKDGDNFVASVKHMNREPFLLPFKVDVELKW